jgi:hypothetical protein
VHDQVETNGHPGITINGHGSATTGPGSVRLTPGPHSSPRDGACVVELASLIAGEEFSDRPQCVDPVIAAFLRGWNDRAADANRQRLRPYAELIVGTRESAELTRARREICLEWADGEAGRGALRALRRAMTRIRIAAYCGVWAAVRLDEGGGDYAARVAFSRRDSEGAFGLLNAMLATPQSGPEHATPIRGGNGARANGGPPTGGDGISTNGHAVPAPVGDRNGSPHGNGTPRTAARSLSVPDTEKGEVEEKTK